jgi:hypothetical protein
MGLRAGLWYANNSLFSLSGRSFGAFCCAILTRKHLAVPCPCVLPLLRSVWRIAWCVLFTAVAAVAFPVPGLRTGRNVYLPLTVGCPSHRSSSLLATHIAFSRRYVRGLCVPWTYLYCRASCKHMASLAAICELPELVTYPFAPTFADAHRRI